MTQLNNISPDEIKQVNIISVQKIGGCWSWRKFRYEPLKFYLFCSNAIYKYIP